MCVDVYLSIQLRPGSVAFFPSYWLVHWNEHQGDVKKRLALVFFTYERTLQEENRPLTDDLTGRASARAN